MLLLLSLSLLLSFMDGGDAGDKLLRSSLIGSRWPSLSSSADGMVFPASSEATLGGNGSRKPKALSMMVQRSHMASVLLYS